jgi:hypothetical protein
LSNPSPQLVSVASGAPPLPEHSQAPPPAAEHTLPFGAQVRPGPLADGWQEGSLQSMRPLQSLSCPSAQLVSTAWPPGHTLQVSAAPSQVFPFGLQETPAQSGSWQSTRPSQSLSWPSPQLASRASGVPPFPEQTVQLEPPAPPEGEQVWPLASQRWPAPLPTGWQAGSAQSASPSQSLSTPSSQISTLPPGQTLQVDGVVPLATLQTRPFASHTLP